MAARYGRLLLRDFTCRSWISHRGTHALTRARDPHPRARARLPFFSSTLQSMRHWITDPSFDDHDLSDYLCGASAPPMATAKRSRS